ncbi:MAG: hypothetical protein EBZ74_04120 [Planctomycetia bacterium]|nr:hypothetical protein [Planctomycetia bacterium]
MKNHIVPIAGLLLFLAGVQFRLVESFTLSEPSSQFVSAQLGGSFPPQQAAWGGGAGRRVVAPPRWLGLALMSVGSVLTLKGLARGKA